MKSIEFCYWLQGMFELSEVQELDALQTQKLKNHLAMVFVHDPQPHRYCAFLNGFLKIQDPQTINAQQTRVIKEYLYHVFEHVVAPKTPAPAPSRPPDMLC